ncbi:hypothetical protein ETH_00011260 [Eimeria tenella]|uniref:Elongation factor Tu GTP-binding domain-containing protein n=1 Tax=Eimeria tenella TaxID=5802 RepID=U6KVS2_EIMTE|nr:hypothetical protein ETH_00011260 [Eimeria tenella]CDJ42071.1 hypothetical protein ETH_00011260 [Eimeria tenella]|eukprot:XP_013232821.1 hypothetical protein ETH_00011260 [Eimeria tenella]
MSSMRARAAAAADVAVVVIEANKEQQQQTEEAIKQADACGLPVIFVLNKIDKLLPSTSSTSSSSRVRAALLQLQEAEQQLLQGSELSAAAAAAAAAAAQSAHGAALQQLLLLRMQLRRACQRMAEEKIIERDFSSEAMNALAISALYGHGVKLLLSRIAETTALLQLPLRGPSSFCVTPGAATRYRHVQRRSDCLVEGHLGPSAVGLILDIQQTRDRGLIYTVLLKSGALSTGNYFVAGSVYGRISSVWRHSCTFKEAPYTPEALGEDRGPLGAPFEVGSVLEIASQRGKGGEAAIDDLLLCLPQTRAYRLAKYRQALEQKQQQQIDGPLLQLPWEVDHPKQPGSRWHLLQQQQQQIRRPVSAGRRAIEEFGIPDDDSSSSSSSSSSSKGPLFTDATRADFERPMRSLPLQGRCRDTPGADADGAAAAATAAPGEELLDEMELLGMRPKTQQQQQQTNARPDHIDLEPIVVSPEEDSDDDEMLFYAEKQKEQTQQQQQQDQEQQQQQRQQLSEVQQLGRSSTRRRRQLQHPNSSEANSTAWGFASAAEAATAAAKEMEAEGEAAATETGTAAAAAAAAAKGAAGSSSLRPFETQEEWAERVVRENEELMSRWRAKSRQRKEAYEQQQRLLRATVVEAEQQRRKALQEPLLSEEEVNQLINGEDEKPLESSTDKQEIKTIPAPPKDAPVVPVILRTRYVGSFDLLMDEFEKIEVEMGMRIPVVHGGIGPVAPRDIVHAEVERSYGYCPVYAFQVPVLPDAVKQALVSKVIVKKFDVFTDLIQDLRDRCTNIHKLRMHNLYVRSLKKQPTKSGL